MTAGSKDVQNIDDTLRFAGTLTDVGLIIGTYYNDGPAA